ncbi:MAG: phage/plasmid primase, P4 family, partial [Cyanobacteria bacterium P01_E01_bin.6]
HYQHFIDDGWSDAEINTVTNQYCIRSVDHQEASKLLGYEIQRGGIWLPFDETFGQLRLDQLINKTKYLSPRKGKKKSIIFVPKGHSLKDLVAITEGWKDACIGTIRGGKPVGAIAGVTHVAKVLPKGTGIPLVFDSDGWDNANVIQALIKGGLHLNSKIVLIPKEAGEKAGLTEYFNAGFTKVDFDSLLENSKLPRELFIDWLDYLIDAPLPKHCETLPKLYQKLWRISWFIDRNCPVLKSRIEEFCKIHSMRHRSKLDKKDINQIRVQALKAFWNREKKQHLETRKAAAKLAPSGSWQITNCFGESISFSDKGIKIASPGKLAALMEVAWGDRLKYRLDYSRFYAYGRRTLGQWEKVSDLEVKELVQRELDTAGAEGEYGQTCVDSSVNLFSQRVSVRDWPKSYGLIPFKNGVLRLSDNALLSHSSKHGFTWQLPYEYQPDATCAPIIQWLKWAVNNDESVVQLIRACLKAIVTGRTDFQRYLEVIGPGGTGKGTLIRLIQSLLGRFNTVSTSLSRIANSRFETSRFMGKKLVLIPDADYNPSAVDVLKQLTGEDYIPWERKGENPDYIDGFMLEGWVVVATNKEVVPSDHTNALQRRRIPIYFNRVVPPGDRKSMLEFAPDGSPKGELAPHLPGVFNWVMSMPDELTEAYIKTPLQYVHSMAEFQSESLLQTDSMADWVNQHVVFEPGAWTKIGDRRNSSQECLYPNYLAYCEAINAKPLSQNKFSGALENLLQKQLNLDVSKKRDRTLGQGFSNIRLVKTVERDNAIFPAEDEPLTVEKAFEGERQDGAELSQSELTRFLNLFCDDRPTYEAEIIRFSPEQLRYLYEQLPELQPLAMEVNGHVESA